MPSLGTPSPSRPTPSVRFLCSFHFVLACRPPQQSSPSTPTSGARAPRSPTLAPCSKTRTASALKDMDKLLSTAPRRSKRPSFALERRISVTRRLTSKRRRGGVVDRTPKLELWRGNGRGRRVLVGEGYHLQCRSQRRSGFSVSLC
jgi:hypothetical protein